MRLAAWGPEGASEAVPPASLEVEENRIEYRRGDPSTGSGQSLVEWYRNDEEGLVLGFTLPARQAAGQAGQPLRLDLVLDGDLVPEMVHEGAEIEFRTPDGSDGLQFGALRAEDARGESLAAGLALEGSTLGIWIESST